MVTKPRLAHTLPSLMLAGSTAFPVGASAQAAPPSAKSAPLSAAVAEVRRSPFYATSSVDGLSRSSTLASVPVPDVGDRLDPDSAKGPSFRRVFWPTLGAVFLSEFVFLYTVLPDQGSGLAGGVFGTAVVVAGPAATAKAMGARFPQGLLGSAAGVGLGYGLFRLGIGAFGLDDSVAYWTIPITHALLTTVIGRL